MKRTLVATVLSAVMAFSPVAVAPARADEDVAKVLAGIAALYILSEATKKKRKPAVTQHYSPTPRYQPRRNHRAQKFAPQRCLRDQWTHRGVRQVYGARCMERNAQYALPSKCLRRAETNSGPRRFYTPRCLRKHGWRA